jgi:hypothetical protein
MLVVSNRNIISSIVIQNWIQKNSSWQYVCLPRYEKVIECLKEQKNFSPKIQVTTITNEMKITGQTNLN